MRALLGGREKKGGTKDPKIETPIEKFKPNERKVVLLGTAESGKSTLVKRILLTKGNLEFTRDGRVDYRYGDICKVILNGTNSVLETMQQRNLRPKEDLDFEDAAELIKATVEKTKWRREKMTEPDEDNTRYEWFDDDFVDALKYLWNLPSFHEALAAVGTRHGSWLHPSYSYVMSKLVTNYPSWGGRGFRFEAQDFLNFYYRSTGIWANSVTHRRQKIELFDCGGSRGERRKAVHVFDNVSWLVFCVASSEYDQVLFEDPDVDRLQESLWYFENMANGWGLTESKLMLVFTQVDLFTEKFSNRRIPIDLPQAPTNTEDVQGALQFIANLFLSKVDKKRVAKVHYLDSISSSEEAIEQLLDDFIN